MKISKNILTYIFVISIAVCAQPYSLTERIPNSSLLLSTSVDTLVEMQLRQVFSQLSFLRPVYLFNAGDASNRIFVVEKAGVIKVFNNDENTNVSSVFLDIHSAVNSSPGEAGLLSIAFHPDYSVNGKFYVYYNYGSLYSRVSEFRVSGDPDVANDTTERKIFEIYQPYTNHNGGQIAFGNDGYLYIGLGDGGSGGDPLNSGQNTQTLLGSIMRINIDSVTADTDYSIPHDNPFVGDSIAGLPEIWAWGLRNPWRFSFDQQTGYLWTGDVGQGSWEEVDIIEGGKNYGWRIMEGNHCYNPSTGCDTTGLTMPIVEYSHSVGKSITGGFVYRGSKNPRLSGVYLYGDYVTKKIWGLKYENGQVIENKLIAESLSAISSFGQDENGEVYVVGYDGKIYIFEENALNIDIDSHIVTDFVLYPAYPNPFNPSTIISWQVGTIHKSPVYVDLSIYNILGQKVATLVSERQAEGKHQVEWTATGFASGIYYYRLETETGFLNIRKIILLK